MIYAEEKRAQGNKNSGVECEVKVLKKKVAALEGQVQEQPEEK